MRLFQNANYHFMKYRRFWVAVSIIGNIVGFLIAFLPGDLNVGIDFAGGTQLTARFRDKPQPDEIRSLLEKAGIDASLQRYDVEERNAILIRTPVQVGTEEGARDKVLAALDQHYNPGAGDKVDVNRAGIAALAGAMGGNPEALSGTTDPTTTVAQGILDLRKQKGLFTSWNDLSGVPGMTPAMRSSLEAHGALGSFAVLSVDNVGPQIGKELRNRGLSAVALSLLGMLAYIWFRFELRFGIGAVIASFHDVMITLGLFVLFGYEFNLTTVAAFLTLVGYSVNDTVVIFDRVRENMRKSRRLPMADLMDQAINQTLSRTILTSGTTFLSALSLFLFGGEVIRGFAFVMVIGVVVGTYSSIFIACPFALYWEKFFGAEARAARKQQGQLKKAS